MNNLKDKFKDIYQANYAKVYRLCLGYTNGDPDLSKDLAQETFIKVWGNLDSFRMASSLSTWIYRIAVNTCLVELRNKKKVTITNQLNRLKEVEEIEMEAREVKINKLYQCIYKLKSDDRTIILLELEDLPQKEIADIMGISHEAIRVRVHRIKKELTKCVRK